MTIPICAAADQSGLDLPVIRSGLDRVLLELDPRIGRAILDLDISGGHDGWFVRENVRQGDWNFVESGFAAGAHENRFKSPLAVDERKQPTACAVANIEGRDTDSRGLPPTHVGLLDPNILHAVLAIDDWPRRQGSSWRGQALRLANHYRDQIPSF